MGVRYTLYPNAIISPPNTSFAAYADARKYVTNLIDYHSQMDRSGASMSYHWVELFIAIRAKLKQ